ncbi:branched-chain amino acid ABC transporter permease [Halanaerobium kushneri]|uniref:Amino acid/amide ABC transporter membrane protein 1, HAAT family n=1 Tax=Halanaerobium kushneri TaxID=56779 RepID=A0A1N6S079_9FIRM|nr:branched-chain amino acid ABC transporter permease [Halanaerobium kushneri]SIQ34534.1 amino acid/amide ABC transporter membrane protein 1, HAAT family [Halanaerobium kushneri]
MFGFYLSQLFNGITQGSIYALMAIGYSLIFGTLGLVTFAYGDIVIFGVFVGYYFYAVLGLNLILAMLLALPITFLFGVLVEKICYEKFRKEARMLMLITTVGFGIFLRSASQIIFGTGNKSIPTLIEGKIEIGNLNILYIQLGIIIFTLIFIYALRYFLNNTRTGIGIRALSMDQDAAKLVGVNVDKSIKFGHSLGVVLGVFGGIMLGSFYNAISPMMGPNLGLKAFTAVVLGGITSIPGAVIGGYILGIMENLAVAVFSSGYRDVVAFIILIIVLVVKPSGLFGKEVKF